MLVHDPCRPNQGSHGIPYGNFARYHVFSVPACTAGTEDAFGGGCVVLPMASARTEPLRSRCMDAQEPQPLTSTASTASTASGSIDIDPRPATHEGIAVRDADAIVDRAMEDERAALELRRRLRSEPLTTIAPDDRVGDLLDTGERVIAVREAVVVERHPASAAGTPRIVRLYVTTARLILVGDAPWSIPLDQIDELSVAGEQILIALVDGEGIRLDAGPPRLLRVQIAAARAGIRT